MAKFEDGSYGSFPGIELIAKVLAGRCKMHYTRVAVGKGYIEEGQTPKTMTEPAGYVMDAKISGYTNPVAGECQVTVQINSADVENGFYATGLLLYAEDPDKGEVPYTYLVLENEPEWIRPSSSIVGKLATFDIITAVGDVDTVTAAIDPEALATVERVEQLIKEHNEDPDAHSGSISEAVAKKVQELADEGELVTEEEVTDIVKREIAKRPGGGYYGTYTVTLTPEAWQEAAEPNADYDYVCDVVESEVKGDLVPMGACDLRYFDIANKAGVVSGCETYDGYVRFFSKRIPEANIQATVILFSKGGGSGGSVGAGQGLKFDDEGNLAVHIGDGLAFDKNEALTVSKETVMTSDDLVDESDVNQAVENIFNGDGT